MYIFFFKKKKKLPFNSVYVKVNGSFHIIPQNEQNIGAREEQQDSFALSDFENTELVSKKGVLAVLADGMGGLKMGKEASDLATKTMLAEYNKTVLLDSIPNELNSTLKKANKAIYEMAKKEGLEMDVGTTLVASVIHKDQLYWISVGDSRIYLFRDNKLIQLSHDHIYENELYNEVIQGKISLEEAKNHPERALLTSYLGMECLSRIEQNHNPLPLQVGDRIILCSDGLHGVLSDSEINEIIANEPEKSAELLLQTVLTKNIKYQDNITIIILSCEKVK